MNSRNLDRMWYTPENYKQSESDEITVDVRVPADSFWFSGHFPGEPILPGVAQLGMVFDAIQKFETQKLKVLSISRVRFRQMVRPRDQLKVVVSPHKERPGSYYFRLELEKELTCSGVITVEPAHSET